MNLLQLKLLQLKMLQADCFNRNSYNANILSSELSQSVLVQLQMSRSEFVLSGSIQLEFFLIGIDVISSVLIRIHLIVLFI